MEQKDIVAIAQLPSKEELLSRMVASIKSPMSGLINVFEGNTRNLIHLLSKVNK